MTTVDKSTKQYSTFDPRYIPGCSLWLDATDLNTLFTDSAGTIPVVSTGDNVGLWKDKSTSANNASASSNRPSYFVYGNQKTINFSVAGSQRMTLDVTKLPTGTSSFSMFIISQITSDSGSDNCVIGWGSPTVNSASYRFFYSRLASITFRPGVSTITSTVPQSYNSANSYNTLLLFSDQVTSSADVPFLNGTAFSNTGSRSSYTIGTTNATIGGLNTGSVTNFFNGRIGEIILFNRSVTDTERKQVEGYLASKWGLSSSLPITHPYSPSLSRTPTPIYAPSLSTFTPKSISGCVCWIDASDRSSFILNGSSNVTTLYNKSKDPKPAVTLYGTLPWAYDGLDSSKKLPAFDTNAGAFVSQIIPALTDLTNTTFIVTKLTANPAAGSCAVGLSTSSIGSSNFYRALDWATNFRSVLFAGSAYTASVTSVAAGTPFLFSSTYTSTSPNAINNYLNGGTSTGTINSTSITAASSFCMIGCDAFTFNAGPLPSSYWQYGKISEVIVYNSVLSANDRNTIEGYLAHKWKLQGNLPSTHIYKKYYPLNIDT